MKTLKFLSLLLLALSLAACASEPSKFYVLNPIRTATTIKRHISYNVGLEKIQLAQYLQQPQIVTRKTNHQLHLDEFNRWAEPLKENIQQVLKSNLEYQLKNATVVRYPWRASLQPSYIIEVSISKFDTNTQGRSLLQANIKIKSKEGKIITAFTNKKYITQTTPNNYNSIVAGMNRNLTRLSNNIARLIKATRASS